MYDLTLTLRLVTVIAILFFINCCNPKPPLVEPPKNPTMERNLNLFPSARNYDGPGTIIGVDSDKTWHLITNQPTQDVQLQIAEEEFPTRKFHGETTVGLALGFMTGSSVSLGETSAKTNHQSKVTLGLQVFGAQRERVGELDLIPLLKPFLPKIEFDRSGWRYFVITETVKAKEIEFTLNQNTLSSFGGKAELDKIISTRAQYEDKGTDDIVLKMTFEQPLRVFYKVRRLNPKGVALGGKDAEIVLRDVNSPLDIIAESSREIR